MQPKHKPEDFLLPLVYFLVLIGCLIFLLGILSTGIASVRCMEVPTCRGEGLDCTYCADCLKEHNWLYSVLPLISSISTVLATNFGAVLGISLLKKNDGSGPALNLREMFLPVKNAAGNIVYSEWFKVIACYIYILGLLLAFIFSIILKDACSDELIPDLTKSFYGFIVGALVVFLGAPKPQQNSPS